MARPDARDILATMQRLAAQYMQVGKTCRERAPAARTGVVVGMEPNGKDLHWIPEGDHQPQRCKASDLDVQGGPAPHWLGPVLGKAMREGAYWQNRLMIQAGLARGIEYWPGCIAWAILNARRLAPRDVARAEKLLQLVVPFIESLPPEARRELLAHTPELRQLSTHTGPSPKGQHIRFQTLDRPTWRYPLVAQLPLRLVMVGALPLPPDPSSESGEGEPDLGLADFHGLAPLDPIHDRDDRPLFFVSCSERYVHVLTEEGEVESLGYEDFGSDFREDGDLPMGADEFSEILELAWHTRTDAAFTLGVHLAAHLKDTDAQVFWGVYGFRWLMAHDESIEAQLPLEEACDALRECAETRALWTERCADLRGAVAADMSHEDGPREVPVLPVADLAPCWRAEFSLLAMARRVHNKPAFLDGALDIFSFGEAPFEHGAPPPPPREADDIEPYVPWRTSAQAAPAPPEAVPESAAPAPSPAPATVAVAAPERPLATPVQFSEHALLQAEWNVPSGQDAFIAARGVLFAWLSTKLGVVLPERWFTGAHEAEHKGQRLEVEASEELIALRFEHPDHEHAARRWRVEMVLGAGHGDHLGVVTLRLLAQDMTRLPAPATATPRVVRALMVAPGLQLGGRRLGQPWRVGTNVDWLALRDLLQVNNRDFVLIVTGPDEAFEISPVLAPLALHIQLLPSSLADYVRRRAPIEPGTCHLYALGHTQPRIVSVASAQLTPALWGAHADRGALPAIPTFADVRRQLRDLALVRRVRVVAPESPVTPAALDSPNQTTAVAVAASNGPSEAEELLQLELEDVLAQKRGLESDIDHLTAQLHEAKAALFAARATAGGAATAMAAPERVPVPDSFSGLEAWLPLLGDRLDVAPKAIKEALSLTDYQNQDVALAAIDALHAHYWPMVMSGDEQARTRWNAFLKDKRLRCGPVGTAPESSRYGRAYEVTLGGKSYTLDMHLQGHSARDTRRCLRIYFAVDREKQRIVIGHFPTHLPCHMHYVS